MAREIHIINSKFSNFQLFYNGHKDEKHRKEYDSIDLLLKSIPQKLKDFNSKKPIRVYLEGYTDSQNISLSAFFKRIYPKAEFEVVEGIKELHFVHMPNSDEKVGKGGILFMKVQSILEMSRYIIVLMIFLMICLKT